MTDATRRKITHGRHCTCSACAAEKWTNPELAPCGMHGSACPRAYQPLGIAGSWTGPHEPICALPDGHAGRCRGSGESADAAHYREALKAIERHFLPGDHPSLTYSSDARGMLIAIRDTAREALATGCPCVGTLDEEDCPHA